MARGNEHLLVCVSLSLPGSLHISGALLLDSLHPTALRVSLRYLENKCHDNKQVLFGVWSVSLILLAETRRS